MFLKTGKQGFCLSEILRFARKKRILSRRGKMGFLIKEVTLLLAPSYEATKEMRGRSQVVCISSCQHNLCPAPNGSDCCLHLIQSSEPRVNPPRCHSLAHEVHKGNCVARVNLWACLFRGRPCQQPDPGPRLLRKIRHATIQGSQVSCLQTATIVSLEDIFKFLRRDDK